MDVEVGYAPELDDNLDVRIFGGARGMYADNSFSATEDKAGAFDNSAAIDSKFFGIGPRLGLDLAKRFSDTPFGVSGSVAGAVIFGTAKQTTTIDTGGGPATTESEVSETVVNLETSIGLDYHIANNATVTIGYRGEHFSDVSNFPGGDAEGIWSHGPFLKAKISF
ncbi:Lpg1974 family pore-forming outer membrane protein [Devosia aurantiaca]|uniref:Outer membrane protein beta-barrel domain-containing protein n=1 Tax=Devosia aurantiaca TaxID=2714858 RepID=A0A6M1SDY8_9HYPH|nr:Lpg1974 family pore-forming outer membrane protein [Devosia aurantiaca]NGP17817.1 hypothetical protein [Devosia aurantiaca]